MKDSLLFVNFIHVSKDIVLKILEHRNAPEIRKQMITSEKIQLKEHLNFVEQLKTSTNLFYYAVFLNEKLIGVVDYVLLDEQNRTYSPGCYFFDEPSIARTHAVQAACYILQQKELLHPKVVVKKSNMQALLFNTMKRGLKIVEEDDEYYYLYEKHPVKDAKEFADKCKKCIDKLSEIYSLHYEL